MMFAFDLQFAVIAVSKDPFIVYLYDFAILGLRSMYFILDAERMP